MPFSKRAAEVLCTINAHATQMDHMHKERKDEETRGKSTEHRAQSTEYRVQSTEYKAHHTWDKRPFVGNSRSWEERKGCVAKEKNKGEEESYRERQGCHTTGREGRVKHEMVGEILDGVLKDEVDEE